MADSAHSPKCVSKAFDQHAQERRNQRILSCDTARGRERAQQRERVVYAASVSLAMHLRRPVRSPGVDHILLGKVLSHRPSIAPRFATRWQPTWRPPIQFGQQHLLQLNEARIVQLALPRYSCIKLPEGAGVAADLVVNTCFQIKYICRGTPAACGVDRLDAGSLAEVNQGRAQLMLAYRLFHSHSRSCCQILSASSLDTSGTALSQWDLGRAPLALSRR